MRIQTVLAPTDFSANAQIAFTTAYELARLAGAVLYLVHVAESPLRTAANENLPREGKSAVEIEKAVEELLDSRLAAMTAGCTDGVDVRRATIPGNPHVAIVDFAKKINADLIVVGMEGESALRTLRSALIGSVADTILQNSPCPVVIVRPDQRI